MVPILSCLHSTFKDLSNEYSHAQIRVKMKKLWPRQVGEEKQVAVRKVCRDKEVCRDQESMSRTGEYVATGNCVATSVATGNCVATSKLCRDLKTWSRPKKLQKPKKGRNLIF